MGRSGKYTDIKNNKVFIFFDISLFNPANPKNHAFRKYVKSDIIYLPTRDKNINKQPNKLKHLFGRQDETGQHRQVHKTQTTQDKHVNNHHVK